MDTTPRSLAPLPIGPLVRDPDPRPRPDHATLRGRTIALVPLDPDRHAPALYRVSHGTPERERLWTYLNAGPFEDASALRDWYRSMSSAEDPLFFTVVDAANEEPIGVVSLLAIEPAHGSIEIGFVWYAPEWQRSNANTEANYLLLSEVFDRLGYRRVEWKCDGLNAKSRAAALRLGYRYEGLFRRHRVVRGRNRDTAWFSIIDSEWPAIRAGMEHWLGWDEAAGPRPSLATLTSGE